MRNPKLITDHKWKPFRYRYEVPEKILEKCFSHLDDELDGFFNYLGTWYHLSEFLHLYDSNIQGNWNGYTPIGLFTYVLIEVQADGEYYKVGRYTQ